jgi:outer membrane protein assembly factor BamB
VSAKLKSSSGEILQMDPDDGKIIRRYKVGQPIHFQPATDGGTIYVGTEHGEVLCIDTGDKKFTGWPCWGANAAHTGLPPKEN